MLKSTIFVIMLVNINTVMLYANCDSQLRSIKKLWQTTIEDSKGLGLSCKGSQYKNGKIHITALRTNDKSGDIIVWELDDNGNACCARDVIGSIIYKKDFFKKYYVKKNMLVSACKSISSDKFILVGKNADDDGLVSIINKKGSMQWERVFKFGDITILSDALVSKDKKSLYVLAHYGDRPLQNLALVLPNSTITLLHLTKQGKVIKRVNFTGSVSPAQRLTMCHINNNQLLIIYDKNSDWQVCELMLRVYDNQLKLVCEKQLLKSTGILPPSFRFKSTSDGGAAIAICSTECDLELIKFNKLLDRQACYHQSHAVLSTEFDLITHGNRFYIITDTDFLLPKEKKRIIVIALELDSR